MNSYSLLRAIQCRQSTTQSQVEQTPGTRPPLVDPLLNPNPDTEEVVEDGQYFVYGKRKEMCV